MSSPDGDVLITDKVFSEAMEHANRAFLLALKGRTLSRKETRWRGHCTFTHGPFGYGPAHEEVAARSAIHQRERERIDALRVSRDPCPMCGTRGDLSCRHRP